MCEVKYLAKVKSAIDVGKKKHNMNIMNIFCYMLEQPMYETNQINKELRQQKQDNSMK